MTKRILWTALAAGLGAGAAFAQAISDGYQDPVAPRVVPALDPSVDWWTILYFVVACLGIAVVSFKNARRTHLD